MGAEENAEEDRRLERRELRNRNGESNRRAEGESRCVEGGSGIRKSQPIVREPEPGEDGGMAYREEQLRGLPPYGTLFESTNCRDEQRGLVVVGLERWVENEDQQSSNRAPLHRSTRAQGESGSKPVGLWRAFCLGPTEELRQTNRPPVDEAGVGLRSRSGREVQRAWHKTPVHRYAKSSRVHEDGRSGRLELAENERTEIQDAENP